MRNVRNPTQVEMDTLLINGAMIQGEEQIVRLIERYGLETVTACMEMAIDAGEKAARAEIAKMPDGVYPGEAGTDWDGQTDKPIWVRLKMTIHAIILTLSPVAAILWAMFLFDTLPNIQQAVGGIGVIIGVMVVLLNSGK